MILVFLILSLSMYLLYNLIPSDPVRAELEPMRKSLKPDEYQALYNQMREERGLNDHIMVRYARWMGFMPTKATAARASEYNGLLQGNFGTSSYFKRSVKTVIRDPISITMFMNIFNTILALGITIPLGIRTAVKKNGLYDKSVQVFSIVGYSIPIFIISLIFIYFFAVQLRWFPVMGTKTPGSNFVGMRAFWDRLYYLALPLIVMTFAALGGMTRYVRAAMIDALSMDYVRTARAKGVREKAVVYSHAWRNALIPIITVIIGWFLTIFSGSLLIENTFAIDGMGKLYILGLNQKDYELVLAIQMFYTIVSLVGVLITDLSYGIVDPRVRVDK